MSLKSKGREILSLAAYKAFYSGVKIWKPAMSELTAIWASGFKGQCAQDYFIYENFFRDFKGPGTYVDVGGNHPVENSNTYYFDSVLGWRGVALEPLSRFAEQWKETRTATLLPVAATGEPGQLLFDEVIDAQGSPFSSVKGSSIKNAGLQRRTVEVRGERLDELLRQHGIDKVELLSIDVEGHEMQVLKGLDLGKIDVRVMVIENNVPAFNGDEEIRRHLKRHGYRHAARVWHLDDVFVKNGA